MRTIRSFFLCLKYFYYLYWNIIRNYSWFHPNTRNWNIFRAQRRTLNLGNFLFSQYFRCRYILHYFIIPAVSIFHRGEKKKDTICKKNDQRKNKWLHRMEMIFITDSPFMDSSSSVHYSQHTYHQFIVVLLVRTRQCYRLS